MLSLPLVPPQGNMMRPHFHPRSTSPPPRQNATEHHRQPRYDPNSSSRSNAYNTNFSPLALLTADEAAIAARKAAIRNFGASWIRPPGVPKTLQAQREEEAEMAEAEEQERQAQGLRDLQARQEVEEARARAQEAGVPPTEGEAEAWAERDLDEEIPDADAETTDVTFNEDSMLEGSRVEPDPDQEQYSAREEAELTGAARDEEELGIEHERNLDDSVPEAGSYQHTDTEVEDSSSDDEDDENGSSELQDSFAGQSARRPTRQQQTQSGFDSTMSSALQGGLQERLRAQTGNGAEPLARSPGSLNLSSSILESSFVGSSPVVQRGRGGAARRRGRMS